VWISVLLWAHHCYFSYEVECWYSPICGSPCWAVRNRTMQTSYEQENFTRRFLSENHSLIGSSSLYGRAAGVDTCFSPIRLARSTTNGSVLSLRFGSPFTCRPLRIRLPLTRRERWIFNNHGVILTFIIHWLGPPVFAVVIPTRTRSLGWGAYQEKQPIGSETRTCDLSIASQLKLSCCSFVGKWVFSPFSDSVTRLQRCEGMGPEEKL